MLVCKSIFFWEGTIKATSILSFLGGISLQQLRISLSKVSIRRLIPVKCYSPDRDMLKLNMIGHQKKSLVNNQ